MAAMKMNFVSSISGHHYLSNSLILSPPLAPCNPNTRTLSLTPLKHPHFLSLPLRPSSLQYSQRKASSIFASAMAAGDLQEALPPALDSTSDPPPVFDGTTRLYISYTCPFAQRAWITRNCKGLQEQIKLVPINLKNRPAWYKEKVYPTNKVPSLEHNNEVRGESLDLIKYIDTEFEGPSLSPSDPSKKVFGDVLFSYTDSFQKSVLSSFKEDGVNAETGAALDFLDEALSKFDDGPFFLGHFSLVDIAYAPFLERYNAFLLDVKAYDLTAGRPNLATWMQEMNKIEGYSQTKADPKVLVESYKNRYLSKV